MTRDPSITQATRSQLRRLRRRIEKNEAERKMLDALRAQSIVEARRRGFKDPEIAELLGVTKQWVGRIAAKRRKGIDEATR